MEKFKPYVVPAIALLVLIAWYAVARPMLDDAAAEEAPAEPAK